MKTKEQEKLITLDEARSIIMSAAEKMPVVSIKLHKLLGYVLAEPVIANNDMPPFDNSAVDGFGVSIVDVATADKEPVNLPITNEIRAGDIDKAHLISGNVVKIFTGACVPPGVDAVIMREYCKEKGRQVTISRSAKAGENIRKQGGEFYKGKKVLPAGTTVTPPVIGLLASLGYDEFSVYARPKVAIVTTGNELIKPGRRLLPGKIYDSNSYALQSAIEALGIEDVRAFHAGEDKNSTKAVLSQAMKYGDIVITAGGVSVGDYDFVKDIFEKIGVKTRFWRIAMKPGKPVYFGTARGSGNNPEKLIFGLPGNPVSVLVTFYEFVKPALSKMLGIKTHNDGPLFLKARLAAPIIRQTGRMELMRGILSWKNGELIVKPTTGQESHMLSGLSQANALIHVDADTSNIAESSMVEVEVLHWAINKLFD